MVKVELVYITREQQTVHQRLELPPGATVADALHASGIHQSHPETKDMPVGIYAKQVALDTMLKEGDRVEIYRPLTVDPKENRRQKARLNK
ncbi:RnfH family protein [Legionella saoudiensis]|uniref:RnfH family protein n=1 Tax=Legionella saoudiensis TaxID=1750561 RepID=UPI0007305F68|nr:RnfH family protein [Legionella saoudiensis]